MAMEAFNGVVMKSQTSFYTGAGVDPVHRVCIGRLNQTPCKSRFRATSLRRRAVVGGQLSSFDDEQHIQYYAPAPICGDQRKKLGWNGVSEKKRAKLVKDLAKNLSMFSELGFGLEATHDKGGVSEAAVLLQAHLEHLRAQGKKVKERKMECLEESSSSSSSSSESSDSECDTDQVVDMSLLRNKELTVQDSMRCEGQETVAAEASPISLATSQQPKEIEQVGVVTVHNVDQNCSNTGTSVQVKRVEVCMGGKCKKMGGQVLMDEFKRVVGAEALVVECKCMGKCKTAPNVRILNVAVVGDSDGQDNVDLALTPSSNPLYLGVRLDDVGFIATSYFGAEQENQEGGLGVRLASTSTSTSTSYCVKQ